MAEDAFIEVTLDELFSYQSASAPLSGQDGQTFTFDLGDIEVNECGTLVVTFVVSCEASLGQALCAEAKIFPNTLCAPADPLWTGASLVVESNCVDDEVRFTVRNTGTGNMEMPAACIVIEDGVMLLTAPDSLELDAGAFFEYSFPANGSTYRLKIEQVPLHPGNSQPISVVEGCGENEFGSFSTGFVNQFNLGDADGFIDIECREVVASYDPNDKHGFPRGYGSENLIYPAVPMEYLINFQNTGNDTAFLVVIRDTISEHLDMTSLRPGASSHDYTWDIDGDNVLVFTFENILLPDSTTNLEGSQGFVEYKIDQREGLPLGTVIENSAAIYFDINDPIITNTTVHKLGVDFVEIVNLVTSPGLNDAKVNIAPNPATNTAWFTLEDWPSGMRTLHLFNGQGQLVSAESFSGDRFELRRNTLTEGVYFFRISTPQGHQASGQLVWKR
ncbi:MAG: T9SS type A sorting domain-containing protein [Phaeodactylibacter sp.]|nr:T9SS type A sorting domain-containing protein [Phaeodactylibacter sp.]